MRGTITFITQTDQIMELVTSSEVIELQDNTVKRFTEANKNFVRSQLTKVTSWQINFDGLEKHPFLSPSMHFTLALNNRSSYPPYLYSNSFDLSNLTVRGVLQATRTTRSSRGTLSSRTRR